MDRSELLREALRRHLDRLASKTDTRRWNPLPLDEGERSLVDELRGDDGRILFDLVPTDRRQDDEIKRVLAMGAARIADHRNSNGTGWMVLADPDGNRFCVLRSDEERAGISG